jgi:hypothetical protein
VTSGASGSGAGRVTFSVDANTGSARDAAIQVAGRAFAVHQTAGCSYSVSAASSSFGVSGGSGAVDVTTGAGCGWSASVAEGWVRITSAGPGQGSGRVEFQVDPNSGGARTTTLTVAGHAHAIAQAGACNYSIDPSSGSLGAGGGGGTFAVAAADGCGWSAVSNETWLQVTGGGSGTGNGTVSFAADPNSGPERTGAIAIQGLSFVLQQASGCSITLSAPGQAFDAAGGQGSVAVTTADGCAWVAQDDADWISIDGGGSGSGAGTIQFSVGGNAGPARTGTITVGGQTFTIAQSGI